MAVTVGLVGAGRRAADAYAPALASCPAIDFAGLWARSRHPLSTLAERHGVPAHHGYADLLDHSDAVVFAVPSAVEAELAATAALQGKAVLLERPIAGHEAGAEELVVAVRGKEVVSQVAFAWRYSAAVRRFLAVDVPRTPPAGGCGRAVSRVAAGSLGNPWPLERGILHAEGADLLDLLDAALGPVVHLRAHGSPRGWLGMILDHRLAGSAKPRCTGRPPTSRTARRSRSSGPAVLRRSTAQPWSDRTRSRRWLASSPRRSNGGVAGSRCPAWTACAGTYRSRRDLPDLRRLTSMRLPDVVGVLLHPRGLLV